MHKTDQIRTKGLRLGNNDDLISGIKEMISERKKISVAYKYKNWTWSWLDSY